VINDETSAIMIVMIIFIIFFFFFIIIIIIIVVSVVVFVIPRLAVFFQLCSHTPLKPGFPSTRLVETRARNGNRSPVNSGR